MNTTMAEPSTFEISLDDSVNITRQVLPVMSQQRVPTIPQNYAVWWDFIVNSNEDLKNELRRHMEAGDVFDAALCRAIYERYFLDQIRAEVDGIQGAVREAVESVLFELGELGEDITRFSTVLDDCGEKLKEDITKDDLQQLVVELAQETTRTRQRSREVEGSLEHMSNELHDLRAHVNALSRDSLTDPLTGVANRRAFDTALNDLTEDAVKESQPLCLVFVDIDHFKLFNDTHGHLVGDQVLRFVAQEMQQCVKGRDLLARYGGEEFAVLLPSTPLEGAMMLAESIRAIVEAQVVKDHADRELDHVTISLGVAQYLAGEDPGTFVARADACLYASKERGRNKVTGERELDTH